MLRKMPAAVILSACLLISANAAAVSADTADSAYLNGSQIAAEDTADTTSPDSGSDSGTDTDQPDTPDTPDTPDQPDTEPVSIEDAAIMGLESSYTYTGLAVEPELSVMLGETELVEGTDYTVAFANNLNKGTASVTVTGIGGYTGELTAGFKITAAKIADCEIQNIQKYYKYLGTPRTPAAKVYLGGIKLKKGTDYTVTCKNNTEVGTATITIKGKGNLSGSVTKNFKVVRKGWFTKDGKKYYYSSTGKKTIGLYTGQNTYYFDEKGVMQTGWQKIDGEYYFFNRKNGKRVVGKTVDDIKIAANGKVQKTSYNVSKIDTMIRAHEIMLEITKPTDSIETKRLKCFKWVFQFPYHQFRRLGPIYNNKGWEMTFANDIFKFRSGCCVSEAAAVAFLFHECGYENVYVCHDTSHGWIEVNGCLFDPLFAESKSFNANYNVPLSKTDYRKNPVGRRKI